MEDTIRYVVLQETIPEEYIQIYNFIRYNGNEEALNHLSSQIESVRWKVVGDLSCFDIDMDNLVTEEVASQMIKVDLNIYMHRKFDGVLQMIDFGILPGDKNKKKIKKINAIIGDGRIDHFIDKEDCSDSCRSSDPESSDSSSSSESSFDSSSEDSEESLVEDTKKKHTKGQNHSNTQANVRVPSRLSAANKALKLRQSK